MLSRIAILWACFAALMGFVVGGSYVAALSTPEAVEQGCSQSNNSSPECHSPEKRHDANEAALNRYTKGLMIFTGALFVATVFLGFATVWIGISSEKQIALAREEFISSHRPKIRIKHVWLMSRFIHDEPITVRITCVNTGRSTARIADWGLDFFVVREGNSLPIDHKFTAYSGQLKLIDPGISLKLPDFSYTLSDYDESRIRKGDSKFYCAGYVHYYDGRDNLRTTAFYRVLKITSQYVAAGERFTAVENPDSDYEYQD